MSYDIFILSSERKPSHIKDKFPRSMYIESDLLDESTIFKIAKKSRTKFFYVVKPYAQIDDRFDFTYTPEESIKHITHIWENRFDVQLFSKDSVISSSEEYAQGPNKYPAYHICEGKIYTQDISWQFFKSYEEGIEKSEYDNFFVIDDDVSVICDLTNFKPDIYDRFRTHVWKMDLLTGEEAYGGIKFCCKWPDGHTKEIGQIATRIKTHDIFTIGHRSTDFILENKRIECDLITKECLEHILDEVTTEHFFIVRDSKHIDNLSVFRYQPYENIKHITHIWENRFDIQMYHAESVRNHIGSFVEGPGLYPRYHVAEEKIYKSKELWPRVETIDEGLRTGKDYFFVIDSTVDQTYVPQDFLPEIYDRFRIQKWYSKNPHTNEMTDGGSVIFYPKHNDAHQDVLDTPGGVLKRYEVIFLSYNEPFADDRYLELLKRVPWAKRVHGIKGIFNAHKHAASIVDTEMFYVIDADAVLVDEFDFSFIPESYDRNKVFTWRSKNPINDLEYGYGGVKLFPTDILKNAESSGIDFTTSITKNFIPVKKVSNITKFNTDPFNTWKSSFRECTKLSSGLIVGGVPDPETLARLEIWCNVGEDKEFGQYALIGAKMGREYGGNHRGDLEALSKINDFEWLENKFKEIENDIIDRST